MVWIPGTDRPPPPPDLGIEWETVLRVVAISLKDAVALTLNISPSRIYRVQRPLAFTKRLDVAMESIIKSSEIVTVDLNYDRELSIVTLSSVVSFARKNSWSIPVELETLYLNEPAHKQSGLFKPLAKRLRANHQTVVEVYTELHSALNRKPTTQEVWANLPGRYPFREMTDNTGALPWDTGTENRSNFTYKALGAWLREYTN